MTLSTRSRYGLRLLYELAIVYGRSNLSIKQISERQVISEKYLGQIAIPLKAAGIIRSARGSSGGYSLNKDPSKLTVLEILKLLEGGLEMVDCMKEGRSCQNMKTCPTLFVWEGLTHSINKYLQAITLADIVAKNQIKFEINYSI